MRETGARPQVSARQLKRAAWSAPTTWDEVCRRASGRRRYNIYRQMVAAVRLRKLAHLLRKHGFQRGNGAALAQELRCSRATISRDLAKLRRLARPCPTCGQTTWPSWDDLDGP